jgi:hypothetical protein
MNKVYEYHYFLNCKNYKLKNLKENFLKKTLEINSCFSSLGKNDHVEKSPFDYLTNSPCDSLYISPVTSEEIVNEISKLKLGKATGPFSIPVSILKILGTVISKPLETLFNVSFSMGIVPSNFKIANILPIYKNGSPTSSCNYRPISLLSVFNNF